VIPFLQYSTVIIWISSQIILAWLLADFLSGVIHWFQDRYCKRHWPIIGDIFVKPNDIHHVTPRSFTDDGFLLRNWASFAVATMCGVLFWATGALNWFTGGFTVASSFMPTQAHYWAHRTAKQNGPLITKLQLLGVIQSGRQHWCHHRGNKDKFFCTMTDYMNPILEKIQFFPLIESAIYKLTRIKPKQVQSISDQVGVKLVAAE